MRAMVGFFAMRAEDGDVATLLSRTSRVHIKCTSKYDVEKMSLQKNRENIVKRWQRTLDFVITMSCYLGETRKLAARA